MAATFTVSRYKYRNGTTTNMSGTLVELVETFSYTLECGASYSHEKGNKKINRNPRSISSLITNLNNAASNAAANGDSGVTYSVA